MAVTTSLPVNELWNGMPPLMCSPLKGHRSKLRSAIAKCAF